MKWPEHGYIEIHDDNMHYWKCSRLWKLTEDFPVEHISLDDFDWENDNFQWNLDRPPFWKEVGDHTKRILATDLQYPIILSDEGNIMDGMHRVLKSYVFGLPTVKAVRFSKNPEPDMIVPVDDN
ncbi:MAG: chromosome partitioning protein ParB [Chloroflexota bacterium]